MSTRTTLVGTLTAGDFETAAAYNDGAGGWLGDVQKTSDSGAVTVQTAVSGMSVTVTVGTSRKIKVHAHARMNNNSGTGGCSLFLYESTTQLDRADSWAAVVGNNTSVDAFAILTPSAGAHTYHVEIDNANSGAAMIVAAATYPAFIYVTDEGPA